MTEQLTDEVIKVRERIHKLADTVQLHEKQLAQHDVMIQAHTTTVESLRTQMSTREQLQNAVSLFEISLESSVRELTAKLTALHDDLSPIKRGIYWVVTLIIGSVLLAMLALVLKK